MALIEIIKTKETEQLNYKFKMLKFNVIIYYYG